MLGNTFSRGLDGDGGVAVSSNGANGKSLQRKSAAVSFIPRDNQGNTIESPLFQSGRTGEATRLTAYTVAAYAYIAMRYRAEKVSEAPLMVVEETDDGEEWLDGHELAGFLDEPSPDYDMGELLYLTRIYRDMTGMAIWVKDNDRAGRVGRLTPFHGEEFEVRKTTERIYGEFRLTSRNDWMEAERVVFFREPRPGDWWHGLGWVEVALQTLNLGQAVTNTARNLLRNAIFPSLVVQAHPEWNPDDDEWSAWIAALDEHAKQENKGKVLGLAGGGTATPVQATIAELLPGELLDRVESVIAALSGIPAVVLQYHVGIRNSPWSQMEEARRMAYEDAIETLWKRDERVLTRQLLRPVDPDPSHYIRFDRSRIGALKADDAKRAAVAAQLEPVWTVDEVRIYTGQEPHPDPAFGALTVTQARAASQPQVPFDLFGSPRSAESKSAALKVIRVEEVKDARFRTALVRMVRDQLQGEWETEAAEQLQKDANAVARAAADLFPTAGKAATKASPPQQWETWLAEWAKRSQGEWATVVRAILEAGATRAAEFVAADLGVSLQFLRPEVLAWAERETAWLVTEISDTTQDAIARAVRDGIEAGEGSFQIARRMQDLPEFDRQRARLVARTETTRTMNGAPTEALINRQRDTGRQYMKTWHAVLDERTRDEHVDMNGETVPVDQPFSNGLDYPSEPNCRCVLLYSATDPQEAEQAERDAEAVERRIDAADRSIVNEANEHAVVMDEDGSVLFRHTSDAEDVIYFSEAQVEQMKDGVFTHNHPGTHNSFSRSDIELAVSADVREIRAVAPKADSVFSLRRPEDGWGAGWRDIEAAMAKADEIASEKLIERVLSRELTGAALENERTHALMTELAQMFGWDYRKIPLGS